MRSDDYSELSTWGQMWDVSKHYVLITFCFTFGNLAFYGAVFAGFDVGRYLLDDHPDPFVQVRHPVAHVLGNVFDGCDVGGQQVGEFVRDRSRQDSTMY